MTTLKTVADLKRNLPVGAVIHLANLRHPLLSGRRTVLKAQTARWCFSFPEGHPKFGDSHGSWLDIPKRPDVTFRGATAILTHRPTGEAWLWITVEPELNTALLRIRTDHPTATSARFQTSDQEYCGFTLQEVDLPGDGQLSVDEPAAFEALSDAIDPHLSNIAWNGVMGEDRGGAARIYLSPPYRRPDPTCTKGMTGVPTLIRPDITVVLNPTAALDDPVLVAAKDLLPASLPALDSSDAVPSGTVRVIVEQAVGGRDALSIALSDGSQYLNLEARAGDRPPRVPAPSR